MEKIIRQEIIPVKGTTKLYISDPWYKDDNNLNFNGNITAAPLGAIKIERISEDCEFNGKTLTIDSVRALIVQGNSQDIVDTYLRGEYYPAAVKKDIDLGCDTARFEIETKYGYDEFHTGADGYYGHLIVNKKNYGMILELNLDADLLDYDEVKERLLNLFPRDKRREVA